MKNSLRFLVPLALSLGLMAPMVATASATAAHPSDSAVIDDVSTYLRQRAQIITGRADELRVADDRADLFTSSFQRDFGAQAKELTASRDWMRSLPFGGHRDAEVRVELDRIDRSKPGVIHVAVTERTKLFFGNVSRTVDPATGLTPPQYEEYRLRHDFILRVEGKAWKIASTLPHVRDGAPPPPTQADKTVSLSAAENPDSTSASPLPGQQPVAPAPAPQQSADGVNFSPRTQEKVAIAAPLDWLGMLQYADTYWDNYNPSFREYPNDCTNFFSQIIRYGGLPLVGYSWNYQDPDAWFYGQTVSSYTWGGAHNNAVYMYNFSGHTTDLVAGDPNGVWKAQPADVLYVNWDHPPNDPAGDGNLDHTMFVSGREAYPEDPTWPYAKELFLTYHTTDRHNIPASQVMFRPGWSSQDRWSALHTF